MEGELPLFRDFFSNSRSPSSTHFSLMFYLWLTLVVRFLGATILIMESLERD